MTPGERRLRLPAEIPDPGCIPLSGVIEGILERDIGIAKYFSYIVIKSPIEKLHYPLTKLFSGER